MRSILVEWHTQFMESASISNRGDNRRPCTIKQAIEQVQSIFQDQPQLSIREAASALNISSATVHRILRKCLFIYAYILQNFHVIQNRDKTKRLQFAQH